MTDAVVAPEVPAPARPSRRRGWRRTLQRFRRQRLPMIAFVVLLLIVAAALLAPLLAPHDPNGITPDVLANPSGHHLLGTDDVGHDLFSRLLFATRFSLGASLMAVVLAVVGGVALGVVSGFVGGKVDAVLMRVVDGMLAFPGLLMAMAIVGILGPGVRNAMIGLAVAFMPGFARLTRGEVLAVREEAYIEAARVAGTGPFRIVRRHVLPNILPPLVVQALMTMGFALLAEGALSFLGLSVQPPGASLGSLLQRGFGVVSVTPRLVIVPGVVITVVSWCCNVVADGVRDALGRFDVGVTPP